MYRPSWVMPPSWAFGLLGYCVLMAWPLESLLHFVRERQYRTADNVIELLV